jgi:CRP/FNR family cyclic AMP-dependent transcriptional regulator
MYLSQGDLFWGMSKDFVREAMETTAKMDYKEGEILFRQGDVAGFFYILIKGRVKLSIGESGPVVYLARHPGEIIGWSSIIGRESYSANAQCVEDTHLIKVKTDRFLQILGRNTSDELILYKRLAEMLGNRLVEVYPTIV